MKRYPQFCLLVRSAAMLFAFLAFFVSGCGGGAESIGSTEGIGSTESGGEDENDSSGSAPTGLQVIPGNGFVTASWDAVTGASMYKLYYGTSTPLNVPGATVIELGQTETSRQITGLTNGTLYYFAVSALVNNVESVRSTEVTATPRDSTASTGALNDTGITWGGNYTSGNNTSCTSNVSAPQDCHQGRDAKAAAGTLSKTGGGHGGFDFTKLGANGQALAIQNGQWSDSGSEAAGTKWSCVKDNHTGLIWEVKTSDGGMHDKDNTYKWGGVGAIGRDASTRRGDYHNDWNALVNGSNIARLCGLATWRVPTREELRGIADYSRINPSIDVAYFPNTSSDSASNRYWSVSPVLDIENYAWVVYFFYGDYESNGRSGDAHLRLVSVGQ